MSFYLERIAYSAHGFLKTQITMIANYLYFISTSQGPLQVAHNTNSWTHMEHKHRRSR